MLCVDCKHNGTGTYIEPCASCYSARDERGFKTKPSFESKKNKKEQDSELRD